MASWGIRVGVSEIPGRSARVERGERERDRARMLAVKRALPDIERALASFPSALGVMTSAFEHRRSGIVVSRIMRCASEPPCVAIAVPSGQRLATLIRDSRTFGLCLIDRGNRVLMKRFGEMGSTEAFDILDQRSLPSGSPLIAGASVALDCEVIRHMDLEADHELYVGIVTFAIMQGTEVSPVAAHSPLVPQPHEANTKSGV